MRGGDKKKSLLALDAQTGKPIWTVDAGQASYSSPQPAVIAGQEQVLLLSDLGLFSVEPATGKLLWKYAAPMPGAPMSIQPHAIGQDQVIVALAKEMEAPIKLSIEHTDQGWRVESRWVSRDLKPSFNDFVVHDGHAYGFDDSIFACIDLESGKRSWKKGRYGNGQVILLTERSQLLVLGETGEAVLLAADPERHRELGKFQAIEGKTWNHPVVAHGRLYVRNAEEMACYDLFGESPISPGAESLSGSLSNRP